MASKYPPSRQVTVGSLGARAVLHVLDGRGFERLADRFDPTRGALELAAGEETVAAAGVRLGDGTGYGLARPADGVVVAHLGSPWLDELPVADASVVVLFDPQSLTTTGRQVAEALLSVYGPVAAARLEGGAFRWGRVQGTLGSFVPVRSVTGERIVAAARDHDAAVSSALRTVQVSGALVDAVAAETGVAVSGGRDGAVTVVYRGFALTAADLPGWTGEDPGDRVATMSGSMLQGTFDLREHHVLASDPREQVAAAYAPLRADGLGAAEALAAAEAAAG